MTAKVINPMPEGAIRPKAPAAPPKKSRSDLEVIVASLMTDAVAMQDLVDRWAGTPHGEFLFPKEETVV